MWMTNAPNLQITAVQNVNKSEQKSMILKNIIKFYSKRLSTGGEPVWSFCDFTIGKINVLFRWFNHTITNDLVHKCQMECYSPMSSPLLMEETCQNTGILEFYPLKLRL